MKIVSKYKDFYDGAQALGIDKTLVYKRFQTTCEVRSLSGFNEFNQEIWKHLPEPYVISTTGDSHYNSTELIHIEYSSIGFCGRLYPYIRFVKRKNEVIIHRTTFYSSDKANGYIDKLQLSYPKMKFLSEFYFCERLKEEELEGYLNASIFKNEKLKWFQLVNSPTFVFNEEPYESDRKKEYRKVQNKSSLRYVLTNPILKDFEFYKVKDNYTCYQELSQFLGGVLTERESINDNLSDIQKVKQHGFDAKYGFRTRPKKK